MTDFNHLQTYTRLIFTISVDKQNILFISSRKCLNFNIDVYKTSFQ